MRNTTRPRDTVEKLNYAGLTQITRLMTGLTRSLASRPTAPDYIRIEKPRHLGSRGRLRPIWARFPTMPRAISPGSSSSGVATGGPADRAGVQAGDVVRELAGKAIENIYDYTFVLGGLKVDEPVGMTVMRNGQRV